MTGRPDVAAVFLRWIWWRAALHNGWWLVTSVYLVVEAGLSASQLVLIAVAQNVVALVFEIPAGVVADAISRKWSLVASHVLMGTAMLSIGLVTNFHVSRRPYEGTAGRSTGCPVSAAIRSKSLSMCSTVRPASSAVAAMMRSGIEGAR